jgi:uncharacterized membrane protein
MWRSQVHKYLTFGVVVVNDSFCPGYTVAKEVLEVALKSLRLVNKFDKVVIALLEDVMGVYHVPLKNGVRVSGTSSHDECSELGGGGEGGEGGGGGGGEGGEGAILYYNS